MRQIAEAGEPLAPRHVPPNSASTRSLNAPATRMPCTSSKSLGANLPSTTSGFAISGSRTASKAARARGRDVAVIELDQEAGDPTETHVDIALGR